MRRIFLSYFILVFILSLVAVAAEKPQVVTEKPGMTLKQKNDIYNPIKQFQDFRGVDATVSNPPADDISLNEGFENPTFPPTGWHAKNILGGVRWMRASGIAHSGTGSAIIAWETSGGEDWLVTPQLAIEAGDSLKFWTRKFWPANYPPDFLEIRLSTTDTSVASFTTVLATYDVNTFPNPSFGEYKIDLSAFSGQNVYIAFKHYDVNGNGMYLDDVLVGSTPMFPVMNTLYSELVAPPTPTGSTVSDTFGIVSNTGGSVLNISSITLTNSDFSVTPTSGTVNPGDTLFVEGAFTPSTAGPITGLMIIAGDDPGNPSDTISLSGVGYPVNYIVEEFNDFPYYPYNFSRINANGDAVQWGWYLLTSAGDSNLVAGITYAGTGNDDYLVTPPIPVVSGDYISFDSWANSASFPETWQVLVSTTDNQAASFTVGLDTVTSGITSPVRYTYDLSAFDGQTIYVAIRNVSVDMYYQWVDNVIMPMPNYPIFISEIYYDSPGTDAGTFTEIFGKPGLDLTGYILDGNNGNGGVSYRQIDLSGYVIPEDGFFVVGQDNAVPNVDLIANVDWQNGPDNVLLIHGADTVDAIGYGDFSSAVFVGEGNPVPEPFVDYGLGRYPDGFDTNDNAADFYPNYLSAGEPNYQPSGIIGGGSSVAFDTVAVGAMDTISFTIYNNGGTGLYVSSLVTSHPVFTAQWPDGATDTTIAFGSSASLNVIFAPTNAVTYNDSMTITTNDLLNPAKVVSLTGIGKLSGNNASVILAAQIGGDSQFRSFWVNGSWDSSGVYNSSWTGPMVELKDNGVAPDVVAGDHIFTGSVILAVDNTNTYNWWTGSENDDNSFLDNGDGFLVTATAPVYADTLIVDGDNGINEWVISLPGSFNSWNNSATDLSRVGNQWSVVIPLNPGTHEYKYAVMHQWNAAYGSGGIGGAGSNYSINVATAGDFLFTFDDEDNSQSVVPYLAPIFMDDFEAYTAGQALAQQNPTVWTTWSNLPGTAEDPLVSTAHSRSGVNSVNIIPNNDCVKPIGNYTSGVYKMSFYIYVPAGNGAYFNTLQQFLPGAYIWGMQVFFDQNGQGSIDGNGTSAATFTYAYDTWLHNEVIVDLNADSAQYWLNGQLVHRWQWTLGTFGTPGPLQLAANNFYGGGTTATTNYYLDDYSITRLDIQTGIIDPTLEIPTEFALDPNYPNPFNPTTTIRYALKENAPVTLKIYNTLGQEVRTLVNSRQEVGYKTVVWDGLNNRGSRVASGIYIYRLQAGDFVQVRKMILTK